MGSGNYSATLKLVHRPLMGGLLQLVHLVQRGGDWTGCQSPPRCSKCESPSINGQCTSHLIAVGL